MRVTLGNSVTVARQTLTLFVGVRIPIPQPIAKAPQQRCFCFFAFRGIRTRREQTEFAEENSPVDCFRRRGQRAERGDRSDSDGKIPIPQPIAKAPQQRCFCFYLPLTSYCAKITTVII